MPSASLKVLHVITGLGQGGAEGCMVRLILADSENEHTVVSLLDEGVHGASLREHGIALHNLGFPRGGLHWRGLLQLFKILRRVKPEVVQTWMCHSDLLGGVTARLAGVPKVFWGIRNTLIVPASAPASTAGAVRICAHLSRVIPTKIVSCSATASREHSQIGYDAKRMVVIPNGIDLGRFRPDPVTRARVRLEWGITEGEFLLGMVARHDPQKDHANLLESLRIFGALHPGPRKCVLVGRGLERENADLAAAIKAKELEACIIPAGSREDVQAVMNAIDCHVLSSAYGEGFPNAIAEAMACGTPCVATRVGDSEMLVGETGWVVPPRDAQALAGGLAAAASEFRTAAWADRKLSAQHRVESHFQLGNMVAAFRRLWEGRNPDEDEIPPNSSRRARPQI